MHQLESVPVLVCKMNSQHSEHVFKMIRTALTILTFLKASCPKSQLTPVLRGDISTCKSTFRLIRPGDSQLNSEQDLVERFIG